MVRSLPEKTFEHWASMYIAHRFPLGSLWWPTHGEDVSIDDLGTVPSKSLLLEVKVPQVSTNGTHSLTIDIPQLRRYLSSIVPVYYAFPAPPWQGDLLNSGWLGQERRADLAYRRSIPRWFGSWTHVCSAYSLFDNLKPSLNQKSATVIRRPPSWEWPKFWREFSRCGSDELASVFVINGPPIPDPTRHRLRYALITLRGTFKERQGRSRDAFVDGLREERLLAYAPAEPRAFSETYRIVETTELNTNLATVLGSGSFDARAPDEHRQLAVCSVPFTTLNSSSSTNE